MDESDDQGIRIDQLLQALVAIGGIFFVGLIMVAMVLFAMNNQVVRPLPGGAPAPVVPALPDMMAELRSMKTLCEGRAAASIDLVREQGGGEAVLSRGRSLYVDAQSALAGSITYLQAGLSRRFNEDDAAAIAERLADGRARTDAFVTWADALQRTTSYGATGPSTPWPRWLPTGWTGRTSRTLRPASSSGPISRHAA